MFDYELLIPITALVAPAVVLGLWLMFRHRTRLELQKTVRAALDKGQELTPEIIEGLGHPREQPHADLRKALIWIAVGLGFAAFGLVLGEEDAVRPLIAVGTCPLLIGIAYLVISRFSEKDVSS